MKLLQSGYRVTFVDISGAMVERARAKVADVGKSDRAAFLQANLCDLDALDRDAFGLAVAFGDPIGCTHAPAKALKEIRKRLCPGGTLVATFDNKLAALDYYLEGGSADRMRAFLKTGRTHWLTKDEDEQFEIHTYTPQEAVRLVETAGFELVDLRGNTVLNLRHHRPLLAESADRRAWLKLEEGLSKDADAIGRAGHIQIAARRRSD